jgi:uncharacterized protein (TIGR02118 family)
MSPGSDYRLSTMYKLIVHIDRKEGMDEADFHEHWDEEHVPIVKSIPNLVKYTTSVPVEPDAVDFDGIAELYFEEREHVGEAIESAEGQEALADLINFTEADPDQDIVEETVRKDET